MAVSDNSKSPADFGLALFHQTKDVDRTLPPLMNGAPKATRGEIVKWLNSSLLVNIPSIEKAYNGRYISCVYECLGALACQVMDMLYPSGIIGSRHYPVDTIAMSKVNFAAKDSFEIQKNYRLLQNAFVSKRIQFVSCYNTICSQNRPSTSKASAEGARKTTWSCSSF